jgi:phospholipase D1/2
VFILVPLLPAFEGQVEDASTGNALRVILHYNYASMSRGPNSLFSRLTANGINPMNYISFASLR